jgi:hypothetical protein
LGAEAAPSFTRLPPEIEMSDVASTFRLFAVAVLISFSLAVGTAALGTTMRAQAAQMHAEVVFNGR